MKSKFLLAAGLCIALSGQAQTMLTKREIMEHFLNGTLEGNYAPAAFSCILVKTQKQARPQ